MKAKQLQQQLELLLNPDTLCPRIYNFTDVRDLLKAYKEQLEKEPRTGDISAWITSVKASVYYPYFAQQEREKILKEFETGKLKQCDCCGKVKGEEFICGTCSDCI